MNPRSLLIVPGDDRARLDAALGSAADALVVDMEHVASAGRSAAAKFIGAARALDNRPCLLVRIHALGSGLVDDDLALIMPASPDAIVLPGAVGGRDIAQLGAKLAVHEAEHGLEDRTTRIVAFAAESAAALLALPSVAGASPRLAALAFDPEPLAADLGCDTSSEPIRHARTMLLLAARAAGVFAIDGPYSGGAADPHGLAAACRAARSDGFAAKLADHSAEVAAINAAFAGR